MKNAGETNKTIEDLQVRIEKALRRLRDTSSLPAELEDLRHLAPKGFDPRVSLIRSDSGRKIRKIRGNAAVDNWQPGHCQALIGYERGTEDPYEPDRPVLGDQTSRRLIRIKGIPLSQTILEGRR